MQNIFVLAGNIGHTVPIFLQVPQVKRLGSGLISSGPNSC